MDFKLLILFILEILEDLNKWWRACSGLKFTILYVKKWESRGTGNDVGIYVNERNSTASSLPQPHAQPPLALRHVSSLLSVSLLPP
jgi:hypothetical protein